MRPAIAALAALLLTSPAIAEIDSISACETAIAEDASRAREEAALWSREGGGVPARLCEAAALEAIGATATAARLLTALAENPNRAMKTALRITVFEDAARLWLEAEQPGIARAALASADRLGEPTAARDRVRARAAAAEADWPAARVALERAVEANPEDARTRALLAAALRQGGDPEAALSEADGALAIDPHLPEALFESAAALAETGDTQAATARWLDLATRHPDHPLAGPARRNIARLQ